MVIAIQYHDHIGINSFMSWVGGKKALRREIIHRFPLSYQRYIEVFGGAGWVLFYKKPSPFEVYNDFNVYLVNLFRCVRYEDKKEELKEILRYTLNSRSDFEQYKKMIGAAPSVDTKGDPELAAAFYCLIRYSYASGLTSFGAQPHNMSNNFALIDAAHERLQPVIIENWDCVRLIDYYDQEGSLFYLDPPYYEAENVYQNIGGFREEDHIRLRDTLLSIEGRFLLSYNDHQRIRELYDFPGIHIEETQRLDNIRQRYEGGAMYKELYISNYDTRELARSIPKQLTIFDTH